MTAVASTPPATATAGERTPLVGVLALQGDFADHQRALAASGIDTRQIRSVADLAGIDGIVLPGGESTTMLRLLAVEGLEAPLAELLATGLPIYGTCAGLILLATTVTHPAQRSFGVLPLEVCRNGYGRQVHSGTFLLSSDDGGSAAGGDDDWRLPPHTDGIFIRAPRIVTVGADCRVLARRDGDPVLVRRANVLAACFHPELAVAHPVTALFAAMCRRHVTAGITR